VSPPAYTVTLARGGAALAAAGLLVAGLVAIAQRTGFAPSAACSLLLGAGALLLWLALPGRLTLVKTAGAILLAIGLLAQLELGLGAPESSWLRYYQKSAALLAIGAGLGGLLQLWAQRHAARGAHLHQRTIEWLLALFAAVAGRAGGASPVGRRNRRLRPATGRTGQTRPHRPHRPLPGSALQLAQRPAAAGRPTARAGC
jgi:cell division protein FtsW